MGLAQWCSTLILVYSVALASHVSASSYPAYSTFKPALCLWPGKRVEDGPRSDGDLLLIIAYIMYSLWNGE